MKRQSEELIFKYKTKPQKSGANGILFELPLKYNPIPGDIIEMIISENDNNGQVNYYARMVCYQVPVASGYDVHVGPLIGKIEIEGGGYSDIYSADITAYGDGYAMDFQLDSSVPFVGQSDCIVNLIIHRSKTKFELYYL